MSHELRYPDNEIGQLTKHPKRKIFFKNSAEDEAGKLVPDRFLFFKKDLY